MNQEHNRNSYGFIDNEKVVETIVAYHSRMVFSVIGMFLLLLMPFILKIFVPNTGNSVFGGNSIFHVLLFIFLVCSLVFVGYKALNGGISSIFTWWLWNPACKKANECKLFKSRYLDIKVRRGRNTGTKYFVYFYDENGREKMCRIEKTEYKKYLSDEPESVYVIKYPTFFDTYFYQAYHPDSFVNKSILKEGE